MLIQTRNPDERILEVARSGMLLPWYRSELSEREQFLYPPYATIIKVTVAGSSTALVTQRNYLANMFKEYSPDIFKGVPIRGSGTQTLSMVLRIPRNKWSLPTLSEKGCIDFILEERLRSLPLSYRILIDPENLL